METAFQASINSRQRTHGKNGLLEGYTHEYLQYVTVTPELQQNYFLY